MKYNIKPGWNKKILNRSEYVWLRNLFFKKKKMPEIQQKTGLKYCIIHRIAKENNWYVARDRYYKFLCFLAYKNETSIYDCCKKLDLIYESVKRVKQLHNIKTKRQVHNKKISDDIKKNMINDYINGESGYKVCKKYGFSTSKTVYDALDSNNIKRREKIITYYNENYFEKIDSHDKAYILGLLLTDGYVIKNYEGIAIQLILSDKYILEKIAERLGKSCTVKVINCDSKRKTMPNAKDMARLCCHCPKISKDLVTFSMVKRKTKILRCPTINLKYSSSFFRGLWDGDGSIGKSSRGYFFAVIPSASYKFLNDIKNMYKKYFDFNINKSNNIFRFAVAGGQLEIFRFYKWIYKDKGDLYLRRKFEKVQNIICD